MMGPFFLVAPEPLQDGRPLLPSSAITGSIGSSCVIGQRYSSAIESTVVFIFLFCLFVCVSEPLLELALQAISWQLALAKLGAQLGDRRSAWHVVCPMARRVAASGAPS